MSDKIDDGGFAFPHPYDSPGGMSLRDYFAAAALQTLKIEHYATMSTYGTAHAVFASASPVEIARRSYEIADAMLAARKAKP